MRAIHGHSGLYSLLGRWNKRINNATAHQTTGGARLVHVGSEGQAYGCVIDRGRYHEPMTMNDDIDPDFLRTLAALAGSGEELAFERRGEGASTYPFHGKVVSINMDRGSMQVLRTRTHAGEVHEMGMRYFLSATRPSGEVLHNRVVGRRNDDFHESREKWELASAQAFNNPLFRPPGSVLRFKFVGTRNGKLSDYTAERFVFQDNHHLARKVGLVASSADAAHQFMVMQDLFLPLEYMYWHASVGRVLWPAAIALKRTQDPSAWAVDWLKLYGVFDGLDRPTLGFYMERFNAGRLGLRTFGSLTETQVQALKDKGLLFLQTSKSHRLAPPSGLSSDGFQMAVRELRDSIHMMRQWLKATYDFHGEEQLCALADVA